MNLLLLLFDPCLGGERKKKRTIVDKNLKKLMKISRDSGLEQVPLQQNDRAQGYSKV